MCVKREKSHRETEKGFLDRILWKDVLCDESEYPNNKKKLKEKKKARTVAVVVRVRIHSFSFKYSYNQNRTSKNNVTSDETHPYHRLSSWNSTSFASSTH